MKYPGECTNVQHFKDHRMNYLQGGRSWQENTWKMRNIWTWSRISLNLLVSWSFFPPAILNGCNDEDDWGEKKKGPGYLEGSGQGVSLLHQGPGQRRPEKGRSSLNRRHESKSRRKKGEAKYSVKWVIQLLYIYSFSIMCSNVVSFKITFLFCPLCNNFLRNDKKKKKFVFTLMCRGDEVARLSSNGFGNSMLRWFQMFLGVSLSRPNKPQSSKNCTLWRLYHRYHTQLRIVPCGDVWDNSEFVKTATVNHLTTKTLNLGDRLARPWQWLEKDSCCVQHWPDQEGRGGGYPDPGEQPEHADQHQVRRVGGHQGEAEGGQSGQQHHAWSDIMIMIPGSLYSYLWSGEVDALAEDHTALQREAAPQNCLCL